MATTGNQELDDYLLANLGDVSAARSNLLADLRDIRSSGGDFKDYQKTLANLRNIRGDVEIGNTGHLYNVELKWPDAAREAADPLGEQHLLDWHAPISEQPQAVQDIAKYFNILTTPSGIKEARGSDLYSAVSQRLQQPPFDASSKNPGTVEGSEFFYNKGIPGIRYLDQGSRASGTGSRNYVMFDDRFPNIVTRNGVSLTDLLRNK